MKKNVPIAIRNFLEKTLGDNPNLIRAVFEEDVIVVFREKHDSESPFFFKVESVSIQQSATNYVINFLPANYENLIPARFSGNLEQLQASIKTWLNLLIAYNKESIIFDDVITQKYYDDLEPKFKIIDEDADFAPHNFEQQEHLQRFLENAKLKIEAAATPENQHEAEEIVKDINETKDKISKSTKSENVSRVRKIIAKAYKLRYDVGKELLIEFTADAAKYAIGAAIAALLG